jgi:hypothetical protein
MKAKILSIGIGLAAAGHANELHAPPFYIADAASPGAAAQWPIADAPESKVDELVIADLDVLTREQPIPLAGAPEAAAHGPIVPRFYCGAGPLGTGDIDLVCTVVGRASAARDGWARAEHDASASPASQPSHGVF